MMCLVVRVHTLAQIWAVVVRGVVERVDREHVMGMQASLQWQAYYCRQSADRLGLQVRHIERWYGRRHGCTHRASVAKIFCIDRFCHSLGRRGICPHIFYLGRSTTSKTALRRYINLATSEINVIDVPQITERLAEEIGSPWWRV